MEDEDDDDGGGGGGGSSGGARYPVMPSLVALQLIKNRSHLAHLGKKLMKWTEMATGRELRSLSSQIDKIYRTYKEDMRNAFILLARCRYFAPETNKMCLENIAPKAYVRVGSSLRYVSGVKCVNYEILENEKYPPYVHLGLGKGGTVLAECKEAWLNLLKVTIKMVQLRKTFIAVEETYKSATKRENVLAKVIIPRLNNTGKYIVIELEDLAREEVHRIKMVKKVKQPSSTQPKKPKKPVCPHTCPSADVCDAGEEEPSEPLKDPCPVCIEPPHRPETEPEPCSLCQLTYTMQKFLNCIAVAVQNLEGPQTGDNKERREMLSITLDKLKDELKSAIDESSDNDFVEACLGVACKVDENLQILLGTPSDVKLLQEQLNEFISQAQQSKDHKCCAITIEDFIKKTLVKKIPDKDFEVVVLSVQPSLDDITEKSESCSCKSQNECPVCKTKSSSTSNATKKSLKLPRCVQKSDTDKHYCDSCVPKSKSESQKRTAPSEQPLKSKSDSGIDKCPFCQADKNKIIRGGSTASSKSSAQDSCTCGSESKVSFQGKSSSKSSSKTSTCSCQTKSKGSVKSACRTDSSRSFSKGTMKNKPQSKSLSRVSSKSSLKSLTSEKCPVCYPEPEPEVEEDEEKCPRCYPKEEEDNKCPVCEPSPDQAAEHLCPCQSTSGSTQPCTCEKDSSKKCTKCKKGCSFDVYWSVLNPPNGHFSQNYERDFITVKSISEQDMATSNDNINDIIPQKDVADNLTEGLQICNENRKDSTKWDHDFEKENKGNDSKICPICLKEKKNKKLCKKHQSLESSKYNEDADKNKNSTKSESKNINVCSKCNGEIEPLTMENNKKAIKYPVNIPEDKLKTKLCGCPISKKCNSFKILSDEKKSNITSEDLKIIDNILPTTPCGCVEIDNDTSRLICIMNKPSENSCTEKVNFKKAPILLELKEKLENEVCEMKNKELTIEKSNVYRQESVCLRCDDKENQTIANPVVFRDPLIKPYIEVDSTRSSKSNSDKSLTTVKKCPICFKETESSNSLKAVRSCTSDKGKKCSKCNLSKKTNRKIKSCHDVGSEKRRENDKSSQCVCDDEKNENYVKPTKEISVCTKNIGNDTKTNVDVSFGRFKRNIHTHKEIIRNQTPSGKFNEAIKCTKIEQQHYDPYAHFFEISDDDISDFNDDI